MMDEPISRRAAMERLMAQNVIMDGSEYHNGFNAGVNRAQEVIRNLPSVQSNCGIPISYLRKKERQCRNNGTWAGIVGAEVIALIIEEWEGGQT